MKKLLTILFFIPLFCFSQCNINKFDLNYPNKFLTFSKNWMLKRVYEYLSLKNDIIKIR